MALGATAPRDLAADQRVAWLRLIRTENVGPATFRQLINRFGSAAAALDALPRLSRHGGRSAPLAPVSQTQAEDELAALNRLGAKMVAMGEPDYPDLLALTPGAPPLIAVLGAPRLGFARTLAMVGARNASAAGTKLAANLARELGSAEFTIVSGLARGIDAAAHRGALTTGTVAVLAGGLNRIYPAQHEDLAADIVGNGGALLTEMPLDCEPRARDFPRRNRLVSGLSRGTLVVEAARRSGSLITARLALEQNREVFAIPGSPLDPRAEGGNALIKQGAVLVTSAADIVQHLAAANTTPTTLFEPEPEAVPDIVSDSEPGANDRQRLLDALSVTPIPVDDLIAATGINAALTQALLLELDLAGRLEHSGGQMVALRH